MNMTEVIVSVWLYDR